MKQKTGKKILSFLLSLVMVMALMPMVSLTAKAECYNTGKSTYTVTFSSDGTSVEKIVLNFAYGDSEHRVGVNDDHVGKTYAATYNFVFTKDESKRGQSTAVDGHNSGWGTFADDGILATPQTVTAKITEQNATYGVMEGTFTLNSFNNLVQNTQYYALLCANWGSWYWYTGESIPIKLEPKQVTFIVDNGSPTPEEQVLYVNNDDTINKPTDPTRPGYTFGGWYKEPENINKWNFETDKVTEDTSLYAKWLKPWPKTKVNGSAPAGDEGTVDLSAYIAEGGTIDSGEITITGQQEEGYPKWDSATKILTFKFAQGSGESSSEVTIPVKNSNEFADYNLVVTVSAPLRMAQILTFEQQGDVSKLYGETFTNKVTVTSDVNNTDTTGSYGTVSYSSSEESVATVDSDGMVTIIGVGTTVITANAEKTTSAGTFTYGGKDYAGFLPASASYTLTVSKTTPSVVAPAAKAITYTGEAVGLINAGSTGHGTLYYALGPDGSNIPTSGWSTEIPKGTEAGIYYVWYKVKGDNDHTDSTPVCISVTISQQSIGGGGSYTPPTPPTPPTEKYTVPVENESTVQVETTISDGTAKIGDITAEDIEKVTAKDGDSPDTTQNTTIEIDFFRSETEGRYRSAHKGYRGQACRNCGRQRERCGYRYNPADKCEGRAGCSDPAGCL